MGEVRLAGVGATGLGAADEHRGTVAQGALWRNTYRIFYGTTSAPQPSINHLRAKIRPFRGKFRPITAPRVESRAGAPTVGSGGDSVAFAPGLSPAPIVTFPAPAPRTRRADFRHRALQWDHAPRTRTAGATRAYRGGSDPRHHLRPLHGFRSAYPSRIRRAVEPVHASTTSNLYRSTPSLMHAMLPESSPSTRGPGIATPASSLPSDIAPHLRPLSSAGITRRLRSYGPLRHPDGPACPSRDSGWCVHTTDRASRVASIPLLHACRRHYPGGTGQCARRSLPSRWQPSPFYRRVGFRITRFEACSAFTKVAARMLAEPPMAALLIGVLQTRSLPPSPAPTATGWSDSCRAGFAPAEGRRLRTAHGKVGLVVVNRKI